MTTATQGWPQPIAAATRAAIFVAIIIPLLAWAPSLQAAVVTVLDNGTSLQEAIDQASEGDVIELPANGRWEGPVVVDRAITLRGAGGVVDGGGQGIVLTIAAAGAKVEGVIVENSGTNLTSSSPDACIRLEEEAREAVVRDNELHSCSFGIWVHKTPGAQLVDNRIIGPEVGHRSERGNGIQLYNGSNLVVRGNHITGGRDGIYVSVTGDSLIEANLMERTRYGIHYMYSYDNLVLDNHTHYSVAGIALMQSRHLEVSGNVAMHNTNQGILFRDVRYSEIHGNRLERNGEGAFFYSSDKNKITNNEFSHNLTGVRMWAGGGGNEVSRNSFVGNRRQVLYLGADDINWGVDGVGNYWADYLGWDQAGDGVGDRPYRVDSFTANLLHSYPAAALLMRSPSLELLTHLEQRLPMLRVPTVIDHQPLMRREDP